MKFHRTPLLLALIALGLGGFVYFFELRPTPPPVATESAPKPIFNFKEQEVQTLKIQSARNSVMFEKGAKAIAVTPQEAKAPPTMLDNKAEPAPKAPKAVSSSPLSSVWQMTAPQKVPASEGQIAFLLNLLATGKSDRSMTVPSSRLAEFGLNQPTATITVQLTNQQTHTVLMGSPNFDQRSVYAQIDPPAAANQAVTVVLVPFSFYQAIDRPLSDWKLVPDSPIPSASPAAAPTAGESPANLEGAPEIAPPIAPARSPQPTPTSSQPKPATPAPTAAPSSP